MAHYTTTVRSPWPADKAFDFVADLRNFEDWDPGVESSTLVEGDGPGVGTAYDVKVKAAELRYRTLAYDAPRKTVVEAKTTLLFSYDVIEVTPTDDGCDVTYDATFEVNGILGRVLNPVVGLFFNRIGDAAAEGLETALDGERI